MHELIRIATLYGNLKGFLERLDRNGVNDPDRHWPLNEKDAKLVMRMIETLKPLPEKQ